MTAWPEELERKYSELATRRDWPADTVAAFRASVDFYRQLEEAPGPRMYLGGTDDEGGEWFFEVVRNEDELIATKQVEVPPTGPARRYWWRHLEDDDGFLTDQPIHEDEGLRPVTEQEFTAAWEAAIEGPA